MGLFDGWRRPRFEKLHAPWGEGPSIYEHIVAHRNEDGSLPPDYDLPDEPTPSSNEIRWAPGALDGVTSHHMTPEDDARRAAELAVRIARLLREPTDAALRALVEAVREGPLLACVDALVGELQRTPEIDADRLHALGAFLATRAPERELVKLGLTLLGLLSGTDDRELLTTLGAHDELTLFATVAVMNRPDLGEDDLWTLAKRARGWGRVQSVERLAGTGDSAIQQWLLREGFRNEVMNEYLAYTCAVSGRLHEALAAPTVDAAVLRSTADLLSALVSGGPAEDLRDYAHGDEVSERFLALVPDEPELELVPAVAALRAFVDEEHDWDALAAHGWTPERRARVRDAASAILARDWHAPVEAALDAEDDARRRLGEHVASLVGIDTWPRVRARIERGSLELFDWHTLVHGAVGERLEIALALAERLPLDAIASGPADELGLGPAFVAHGCLDMVLQELPRAPGRGVPLVIAGLASPAVRNRNMAVRALAAWPRAAWSAEAKAALERACAIEPLADVRARMEDALAGRKLRDD
jgi:hypothetical protein